MFGTFIFKHAQATKSNGVGIPPVGLLAGVLLNLYLVELDQCFIKRFPRFYYARHIHEGFLSVPLKSQKEELFDEIKALLKELDLTGQVICLERGDAPKQAIGVRNANYSQNRVYQRLLFIASTPIRLPLL
jgi:hypothetical protein